MKSGAIFHCGALVTLQGGVRRGMAMNRLETIADGAVIWEHGTITAVGKTEDLRNQLPENALDAGGALVTPGLIDAHTHVLFGGCRASEFEAKCQGISYQQIAAQGGGIQSSVSCTRQATDAELLTGANKRLQWMLAQGTTAVEAKTGYGLSLEQELRCLRLLGQCGPQSLRRTALILHAIAPEYKGNRAAALACAVNETIPKIAELQLAEYVDIFVEDGYFSSEDARVYAAAAASHGLKLRMHVDQFGNHGGGALAAELKAVSADHLEFTDEQGMLAMRQAGVAPVLLPGSVHFIRSDHYPDARKMVELGLPVVLATDFNPGSSPVCSLTSIMGLACLKMGLTAAETLAAVTINAAASLEWDATKGSLEVGKDADLVVWDVEQVEELSYWAGAPLAKTVVLGGEPIHVRGGMS